MTFWQYKINTAFSWVCFGFAEYVDGVAKLIPAICAGITTYITWRKYKDERKKTTGQPGDIGAQEPGNNNNQ